ncbi:MAG: phosphoribosylformylglycinamidine synthase subunit PurL [Candidatus Omnitrophica bacterium]|nr:phosphoribosylformylglycinamidine synthase subunit PurL [Candidatus Omnitrophota bacterium]
MIWRIEIKHKEGVFDSLGEGIQKSIIDLGMTGISKVDVTHVYTLEGKLTAEDVQVICRDLLVDPITQEYYFAPLKPFRPESSKKVHTIEIAHNPGVMDPVEESTIKGIKDLGVDRIQSVRTAKKYLLHGKLTKKDLETITNKILANKLIQHVVDNEKPEKSLPVSNAAASFQLVHVDLMDADDQKLMALSADGQLFLNLDEMRAIQSYFQKRGRNPTDCELETIAQTWSEHCYHKTFRGNIRYSYSDNGTIKTKMVRNLLKSTIVKATEEIGKDWCVSVFHDNAGVIEFDKDWDVCFKVETHNHPSALEPFGGANTGIGGVIRDILGTGLGAKPICSTDIFCFAPPDTDFQKLPPGTLHPKRIMKGVVSGVRDYGNKMGIPTVNGAIIFDERFVGNPLVYCGTIGIMPKNKVRKNPKKGDRIVVVGGKTGRDGIHGATFSSGELTAESEVVSSGAVQIGDPVQEKKVLDVLMQARDRDLYTAITDCGAGGLSSAVGEMGQKWGAQVNLEKVPLKYEGLKYDEIWISESQERMVLAVHPKKSQALLDLFAEENVEATVIGEFTGNKRLELYFDGHQVCDLGMEFLHEGNPKITKKAHWASPKFKNPRIPLQVDLNDKLLEVLSHYNVCSKEWVIRQYDHEVQGASIIKPLVGARCDGPSDASVIAPRLGSKKGLAVSNGINIRFGMIDPFWMAASCIDEAVRQIIAVGGNINRIAILDNFCWGNPDKPDRLGGLVRAAQGCYKTAVGYRTPFISGKDSLYNEYKQADRSIAVPGTILISAIGIVDDVTKSVTMDFKKGGNLIYCVGKTYDELGGSIYFDTYGLVGNTVPRVNTKQGMKIFKALSSAVKKGMVQSMHDCSEGGLGVALAEMAFSGGFGVTARLDKVSYQGAAHRDDAVLFSESNSRFIVEVKPKDKRTFEQLLKGIPFGHIGQVEDSPEFIVYGLKQQVCVNAHIKDLKEAWQKTLRW